MYTASALIPAMDDGRGSSVALPRGRRDPCAAALGSEVDAGAGAALAPVRRGEPRAGESGGGSGAVGLNALTASGAMPLCCITAHIIACMSAIC
eukprot:6999057-Prymnesium_polylepis.1